MPNDATQARWWQPRISSTTLLVLQTLLCVYLACWWPTRHYGLDDVREYSDERFPYGAATSQSFNRSPSVILPLVVQRIEFDPISNHTYRRMYVWLFGYVIKVPGQVRGTPLDFQSVNPPKS